jgi:hypothetical protein
MITRSVKRRGGKDINFSPDETIICDANQNAEYRRLSVID